MEQAVDPTELKAVDEAFCNSCLKQIADLPKNVVRAIGRAIKKTREKFDRMCDLSADFWDGTKEKFKAFWNEVDDDKTGETRGEVVKKIILGVAFVAAKEIVRIHTGIDPDVLDLYFSTFLFCVGFSRIKFSDLMRDGAVHLEQSLFNKY